MRGVKNPYDVSRQKIAKELGPFYSDRFQRTEINQTVAHDPFTSLLRALKKHTKHFPRAISAVKKTESKVDSNQELLHMGKEKLYVGV